MAEIRCEDLPVECWELIFNRLDHHSHFEALSLVCKRFLSITDRLRASFTIVNPTILIHGTLSKHFNRFRHLKAIDLSRFRGDLDLVILEIATSGLNLEALDVSGNDCLPVEGLKLLGLNMKSLRALNCADLRTFSDIELFAIANSMPWLEELDISHPLVVYNRSRVLQPLSLDKMSVTDGGIEELSSKVRGLRKINISGNQFLSDRSLLALSSNCVLLEEIAVLHCTFITQNGIQLLIRNSTNLTSVSVERIQVRKSSMVMPLITSFACARALSTLHMYDSAVSDEFLRSLANSGIPLKRFTLSRCSDFTFSGISSLLQTYQSLEYLALVGVGFLTDNHMTDLSEYLSALTAIKLSFCSKLTDSTFFTLAKNCPLLKDIDLCRTNLQGGESNVDIVKNPRIKSLDLACNSKLSDECLSKIATICPSLELLDVSRCSRITEKGIASFLKSGSEVRNLQINACGGIKSIGTGFELPKLEVLQAARSGINDEGLAMIGRRCCGLLNLNLEGCLRVSTVGLKEMVRNCRRLREINLSRCVFLCATGTVDWMVFSRPSLRKIIPPTFPTESQRKFFLRHGCLVCQN